MSSEHAGGRLIWAPSGPQFTRIEIFRRRINLEHDLNLSDYYDLHKYSVENYGFWLDLWKFTGIISSIPPTPDSIIASGSLKEVPIWFPTARLNYAENLLYRKDDSIACTSGGELGYVRHYSFWELRTMVREMAAALKVNGLRAGDRVAAVITNSVTAVVVALATTSIGAIFSSTATDMGTQGILDRYTQIQPKFIFAESEVVYANKTINILPKINDVSSGLKRHGLQRVIVLPSCVSGQQVPRASQVPMSQSLEAFLATGDDQELRFEQVAFNHPLYILYSSGTSGPPKCIVHSHGGALLQSKKELHINGDIGPDDTYFQYTTTAWMMWPMMLTGLACGARIVLYDGSPFHPDVRKFLKFVSDQEVSVFGTSPRFLATVRGEGIDPLKIGSFASLRTMTCTGAVLTAPMFEWTQQAFGPHFHLLSMSGGTDVFCTFVTGARSLPVHSGEMQVKSLGMKVEVFDPTGGNIEHTGRAGELVCTRPHPSIPTFWGDLSGQKLFESYFDMYPGVWRQGDFIFVNPKTKGLVITGRSDGVLNPSGVRFGSGEIYTVLEQFSTPLDDALCVGQRRPQDHDERVLLFLKMRPGHRLTAELVGQIKKAIKDRLSARHVPSFIFEIEEIPYTVNGKKIEIAVKQIVSGSNLKPSGTVANPESLKLYEKYKDIERYAQEKAKL